MSLIGKNEEGFDLYRIQSINDLIDLPEHAFKQVMEDFCKFVELCRISKELFDAAARSAPGISEDELAFKTPEYFDFLDDGKKDMTVSVCGSDESKVGMQIRCRQSEETV